MGNNDSAGGAGPYAEPSQPPSGQRPQPAADGGASESPQAIEAEVHSLLAELGTLESDANVSRIDLYVDFQSTVDMEGWDRHAWVTKASSVHAYSDDGKFSGWTVGLGGPIGARL